MRARSTISIVICCFLLLSMGMTSSQDEQSPVWKTFRAKYESPGLKVVWNKHADVPASITGLMIPPAIEIKKPAQEGDILNISLGFLDRNKDLFRVPAESVKKRKVWRFQDKWYVSLQTYYKGIPIYQGNVGFSLDEQGRILTYASDYSPKLELAVNPSISKGRALEIARRHHRPRLALAASPKEVYLTIYPQRHSDQPTTYILAWYVFLAAKVKHDDVDRIFIVDATTGGLIQEFSPYPNDVNGTIRGETYPVHDNDPIAVVPFEHEKVTASSVSTETDLSGNYAVSPGAGNHSWSTILEGAYVKVQSYNATTHVDQDIIHNATVTDPSTFDFTWTSANCAPDDGDGLSIYWHANRLHDDYYQAVLSLNWNNAWTGTSQMTYSVNRGTANNAYAGNPVTIYSNAAARNCDTVYHESTHNVLYDIFGGSYIGFGDTGSPNNEGYAFDEGFADYVACSFNNDPTYGERVHSTRNCNNSMLYPATGYNLEGHTGGQLISGVGWDLWNKEGLNHNATDVLLFAGLAQMATLSRPYYFSDPNHSNYLSSLLIADDDNNNVADGTPHDRGILQAFRNHDMLPVDIFSKDSPQDIGNVPSAGSPWTSPDIWVRNNQDGNTAHENPIYNQANYLYIKVRNLGYQTANTIHALAYWADPATGIPWPSDWHLIGETTVINLGPDSETVAAPISWTPTGTAIGHRCLLVRLECDQDMMTEEGTVSLENNIAQKNISIVQLGSISIEKPVKLEFFTRNYKNIHTDLLFKAKVVKLPKDYGRTLEEISINPPKIELEIVGLVGYGKLKGCTGKIIRGFWPFRAGKGVFNITGPEAVIGDLRFTKIARAASTLRVYYGEGLHVGDVFEISLQENVEKDAAGGITYQIHIVK